MIDYFVENRFFDIFTCCVALDWTSVLHFIWWWWWWFFVSEGSHAEVRRHFGQKCTER